MQETNKTGAFGTIYTQFKGKAAYCKNHIEDGVGFEITGKEYRNCGNGYYYLLINDTYVIGCDID